MSLWKNETQLRLSLEDSEGAQGHRQKQKPAAKTLSTRVAEMHKWRDRRSGKTLLLTAPEMAARLSVGLNTVHGMMLTEGERKAQAQGTRASISRLNHFCRRRRYEYLGSAGRTVQGDMLSWLMEQPVRGARANLQPSRQKCDTAFHKRAIVYMALYHKGVGIKRLAGISGSSASVCMDVLRTGGIDTSARANYVPSRRSIESIRQDHAKKKRSTPAGRIELAMRSRIWSAMRGANINGSAKFSYVGCTAEFLRQHIEAQFADGMSWDNYGEWHIDHIRPCASYDLSNENARRECFNWKNLRPLWASENIQKGAKYAARCA